MFGILRWPILAAVMIVGRRAALPARAEGPPARLARPRDAGRDRGHGRLADRVGAASRSTPRNFSSYSKTYGALASIVVVLLWLWLSSLLVLLGAEVDGLRDEAILGP